jgi:hypothetical protein
MLNWDGRSVAFRLSGRKKEPQMSNFRTVSESVGKLAGNLASGALGTEDALRQLAELLRESLRLMERVESDIQHLRSVCRK